LGTEEQNEELHETQIPDIRDRFHPIFSYKHFLQTPLWIEEPLFLRSYVSFPKLNHFAQMSLQVLNTEIIRWNISIEQEDYLMSAGIRSSRPEISKTVLSHGIQMLHVSSIPANSFSHEIPGVSAHLLEEPSFNFEKSKPGSSKRNFQERCNELTLEAFMNCDKHFEQENTLVDLIVESDSELGLCPAESDERLENSNFKPPDRLYFGKNALCSKYLMYILDEIFNMNLCLGILIMPFANSFQKLQKISQISSCTKVLTYYMIHGKNRNLTD
ncbi:hypothetical protein HDU82_001771, partial [Entophlyctis luteolus]